MANQSAGQKDKDTEKGKEPSPPELDIPIVPMSNVDRTIFDWMFQSNIGPTFNIDPMMTSTNEYDFDKGFFEEAEKA